MYYYIFEQPKSKQERAAFEKIREVARDFGIYGEITQASPARSADELVLIALNKKYSTIVAIGDDSHVNTVVSKIINCDEKYNFALGIISTDPSSILYDRWGFKTAEDACETLKKRKLTRFSVGFVEPEHYFLSSVKIIPPKPTRMTIEVDTWKAEGIIDRIEISNNLYILIERNIRETSKIKGFYNWLVGKETLHSDQSIFKGKTIKIDSVDPVPVYIGSKAIKQTPINIYRKLNALKVITKRDKILHDKNSS